MSDALDDSRELEYTLLRENVCPTQYWQRRNSSRHGFKDQAQNDIFL